MSTRAATYAAQVIAHERLSPRLVRLVLGGLGEWTSTGRPDEWVALTLPGQFQSRYYTVRDHTTDTITVDIVVHEHGLVTEWVTGADRTGETVTVSAPQGGFALPRDAQWLRLVGDLTALPAIARILETTDVETRAWVESPDGEVPGYADGITWTTPPDGAETATAALVEAIDWPDGPGYLWMAGESAQMRAVRTHVMREVGLPASSYDLMGYWRGAKQRVAAHV